MRQPDTSADRCHAFHFDEEFGLSETFDDDQGAGRQFTREDTAADLGHCRKVVDIGDVGRDLQEVGQVTTPTRLLVECDGRLVVALEAQGIGA